jgi:hypothetical protein
MTVSRTHNSTPTLQVGRFAKGGVFPLWWDKLCSGKCFVVTYSLHLRINICTEDLAIRKSTKRKGQVQRQTKIANDKL